MSALKRWCRLLCGCVLLLAISVSAEETVLQPVVVPDLTYGDYVSTDSAEQSLDLYLIDRREKRPVVLFVHGGGWAFGDKAEVGHMPSFFLAHGMAFASMNYRLRWNYKIYDQASDIASAVRWIKDHEKDYGLDASRVFLLGQEAGGHLVSLVGSDERYLQGVGMSFANIACVAAIDTLAFDIPAHMAESANFLQRRHLSLIFGSDEQVQQAASPAHYVGVGESAQLPRFALLYVSDDTVAASSNKAFAKKVTDSHGDVIIIPAKPDAGSGILDTLGQPGDTTTLALITFFKAVL